MLGTRASGLEGFEGHRGGFEGDRRVSKGIEGHRRVSKAIEGYRGVAKGVEEYMVTRRVFPLHHPPFKVQRPDAKSPFIVVKTPCDRKVER